MYQNQPNNPMHLVFDIETIPQADHELSPLQKAKIEEKEEKSEYWKNDKRKEMALSPWFGKVVCIGLYYPELDKRVAFTSKQEKEVLEGFWKEIARFKGTFVSYNGLSFDIPFIKTRSLILNIDPTNEDFLNTRRFQLYPHFDVAQHIADWENRYKISLDLVCDSLGIPSPKEGEVKASTVYDFYKLDRLDLIEEYCLRDLSATFDVFNKVRRFRI